MKIEIQNTDPSGVNGYYVWNLAEKKRIRSKSERFPMHWDDDDIHELLGESKYKQFENGKFIFDVTNKQLFLATNDYNFYRSSFASDIDILNR
jgi:hypothetical protein